MKTLRNNQMTKEDRRALQNVLEEGMKAWTEKKEEEKKQKAEEKWKQKEENEKIKKEEEQVKKHIRENNRRQLEIMQQINMSMIDMKKKQREGEKNKRWNDNQFFEVLWHEKQVSLGKGNLSRNPMQKHRNEISESTTSDMDYLQSDLPTDQ